MRLVFAGTPTVALAALKALLGSRHEMVGVVTRPDARAGRGRTLAPSPVAEVAVSRGLEVLKPQRPSDPEFLSRLAELAPDCCPVVAYGGLLPRSALGIPKRGWVNLHFSVLPAWRGAAPVQRALMAGDQVTGATTFRLVEELDAGPTYGVLTETIQPDDTAGTLLGRLAEHGAALLISTLDGIEDGVVEERPQPAEGVSLAPRLNVADAKLTWTDAAHLIDRQIRGCTPAPGAWTTFDGRRIKLTPVKPRADVTHLGAGDLDVGRAAVLVGTGTHAVELDVVQAPGKAWMRAADWGRGLRADAGRLGDE